jgi:hypothetical protein
LKLQKEFDASIECKPTFEQLSEERILDEVNKDILILKSFETIVQERMHSFSLFLGGLNKIRSSFDMFQYSSGTMRQALDAFFVYIEQVQCFASNHFQQLYDMTFR